MSVRERGVSAISLMGGFENWMIKYAISKRRHILNFLCDDIKYLIFYISLTCLSLFCFSYPCFENPYPMDIHESPVTACQYYAKCPTDLIPAFYSVGARQKKTGFSDKVGCIYDKGIWLNIRPKKVNYMVLWHRPRHFQPPPH